MREKTQSKKAADRSVFPKLLGSILGALLVLLVLTSPRASAATVPSEKILIAAASDLQVCLPEINEAFAKIEPGVTVEVSYGSSGNLYAQIRQGAPFDVFLSADSRYPTMLVNEGKADPRSLKVYAEGHLVLWTTRKDLDLSAGLEVLKSDRIRRIAIANPDVAPYGHAAREALEHEGLWEFVQSRLVKGESVAQAAQFVQTGNADVGLVSFALVKSLGGGSIYSIPASIVSPLQQMVVLIYRVTEKNAPAVRYLEFLMSNEARRIFDENGLSRLGSQVDANR